VANAGARFSGRKNVLSPAKAGSRNHADPVVPRLKAVGYGSQAGYAGKATTNTSSLDDIRAKPT
jgi:hypothetical protein